MNNIVKKIRKRQSELIVMINSTFDEIVEEVSQLNNQSIKEQDEYEILYPITNTSGFKGKKPIKVIFSNNSIEAITWKNVVRVVLEDALKNKKNKDKLYCLCDKIQGRKRSRLSSNKKNMRSPLELGKNLYLETHYDTETLLNLLLYVLDKINYDYNMIQVSVRNQ